MNSILVGVFDTRSAAEQARTKLLAEGFTPGEVTGLPTEDATAQARTAIARPQHEGLFSRFLHSIFGDEETAESQSQSGTYTEALRRGAFGLTVPATSLGEIDLACDILDGEGAVDVDERSEQWRTEGSTGSQAKSFRHAVDDSGTKLNIVEERMGVGQSAIGRGGVRMFTRTIETPAEELGAANVDADPLPEGTAQPTKAPKP